MNSCFQHIVLFFNMLIDKIFIIQTHSIDNNSWWFTFFLFIFNIIFQWTVKLLLHNLIGYLFTIKLKCFGNKFGNIFVYITRNNKLKFWTHSLYWYSDYKWKFVLKFGNLLNLPKGMIFFSCNLFHDITCDSKDSFLLIINFGSQKHLAINFELIS